GCTRLTSITIPDRVNSIGEGAFSGCSSLTSITIPDSVTSIGDYAFSRCTSLASITIPSRVTSIGNGVFNNCSSLSEINVDDGNVMFSSENGVLFDKNKTKLIRYPANKSETSYTIPDSVNSIGTEAFMDCRSLESVFLPEGLDVSYASIPTAAAQVRYTVDSEDNVTVTDISIGSQTSVTIPDTIGGKSVTAVYIKDGATGIDVPATATQIKYTVESERTVINEVKLGTYQTDCLLPATLFEKPVYLADASLETCPTVTHDHREKTAANCTEKPVCAICVQKYDEALGHEHSGDWQNDADNHWKICPRNGCNEIIDKEAHDFDSGVVTTEPTEETEGVKTYPCETCGYEKTEPIAVLDHIHATTEEYSSDATGHWHACSGCDEKVDFERHTEDSGTVTTEPTETTEGVKTYKCVKCEYVMRTETIPTITPEHTHEYSTEWKSDSTSHWHECSCGEKTDVEPHTEDSGTVTTEPTETTEGVKTYKCTECGYITRTETIAVLGHTHVPSEEYSKDETGHWHTCSGCTEKLDLAAHTYGKWKITVPSTAQANGKKERSCTVCGYVQEGVVTYGGDESTGDMDNATKPENNACHADLDLTDEEIINKIPLTPEELEDIENGADLEVYMVVIDYSGKVPSTDKALAEKILSGDMQIGMYIDVTLFVKVGDNDPRAVTNTNGDLKITFEMPEKLINTNKNVIREYSIIRVHSGVATVLGCEFDNATNKGSFVTDKFSSYAIAYKDIEEPAPEPEKTVYYPVITSGNVVADKSYAAAGQTVNVTAGFGYDIIVTAANGRQIAKITDKGSFTMPASKVYVKAVQNETFALMATAWRQSYVYSYDADMNKIKVNSTKKRGVIVIDLGEEYAGRTFTIYSGRKSTKVKVTEGEFDENGKFVFEVPDGKNYTLIVED
ncbi:MAG: leucine-rich repeat domain-containing protein, partial [Oscillospiraceae bacterium]|nr:leucine-rich repeat domain-containing protein [Oscillospiraceae bacterium]